MKHDIFGELKNSLPLKKYEKFFPIRDRVDLRTSDPILKNLDELIQPMLMANAEDRLYSDVWWHPDTRFNLLDSITLQILSDQGTAHCPTMYFHVNQPDALHAVGEWIIRVSKWCSDEDKLFVEIHKQMNLNHSPYLEDGQIVDPWMIEFQDRFYSMVFTSHKYHPDEYFDGKIYAEELSSYFSICSRFGLTEAIRNRANRIKTIRKGKITKNNSEVG